MLRAIASNMDVHDAIGRGFGFGAGLRLRLSAGESATKGGLHVARANPPQKGGLRFGGLRRGASASAAVCSCQGSGGARPVKLSALQLSAIGRRGSGE